MQMTYLLCQEQKKSLEETYTELKQEAEALGLIINQNKTKYMKCTGKKEKLYNIIKTGEHEIERVQEFKYLGTQVNVYNIMKEDEDQILNSTGEGQEEMEQNC
jgi:hypothetical protein